MTGPKGERVTQTAALSPCAPEIVPSAPSGPPAPDVLPASEPAGGAPGRPAVVLRGADEAEACWALRNRDPQEYERRVDALPDGPLRAFLGSRIARAQGRLDSCLELTRVAEHGLKEPTVWRARVLETQGITLNDLRLGDDARAALTEAWGIYRELGDAVGEASVQQNLAVLYFQPEETSREILHRVLVATESLDAPDLRGVVLLNYAITGEETGMSVDERMRCAVEAHDLLATSWPRMANFALCGQLGISLSSGDMVRARELAGALPRPVDVTDRVVRSHVAEKLATFYLADGRPSEAVDALHAVLALDLEADDLPGIYDVLCRALAECGRFEEAYDASRKAFRALTTVRHDEQASVARALDVWHRTSVIREDGELAHARAVALEEALTDLRTAHRTIRELSIRDTVTGLHNRQFLLEAAPQALAKATAENPAEVALLDLDHFKTINDTYGHAGGDDVLRRVARVLRDELADTDLVARYGGEEFVVVRPPSTDGAGRPLCSDLELLRARLADPERSGRASTPHGAPAAVGLSAGVATVADGDLSGALRRADGLMYGAKSRGRGRVLCDDPPCPRCSAALASPASSRSSASSGERELPLGATVPLGSGHAR